MLQETHEMTVLQKIRIRPILNDDLYIKKLKCMHLYFLSFIIVIVIIIIFI